MNQKIKISILHTNNFILDSFKFYFSINGSKYDYKEVKNNNDLDFLRFNSLEIILISPDIFFSGNKDELRQYIIQEKIKIIMLGHFSDKASISYLISQGINCYLNDNESYSKIFEAIDIVHKAGMYCPYEINFHHKPNKIIIGSRFTAKELEIFKHLRRELTNSEVAKIMGVHVKTVEFHRKNIIEKCGSKNLIGALDYLISSGKIPIINK